MQKLTSEKAAELLKELQYAKVRMGGQLSIRDEYFKQALEKMVDFSKNKKRKIFTCTGCKHSLLDDHPSVCDCMEKHAHYVETVCYEAPL